MPKIRHESYRNVTVIISTEEVKLDEHGVGTIKDPAVYELAIKELRGYAPVEEELEEEAEEDVEILKDYSAEDFENSEIEEAKKGDLAAYLRSLGVNNYVGPVAGEDLSKKVTRDNLVAALQILGVNPPDGAKKSELQKLLLEQKKE